MKVGRYRTHRLKRTKSTNHLSPKGKTNFYSEIALAFLITDLFFCLSVCPYDFAFFSFLAFTPHIQLCNLITFIIVAIDFLC